MTAPKTHAKKRLEIVVERLALKRLRDLLGQHPVTGYTVLPVLAGSGSDGDWSREGLVSDTGQMVTVICILDSGALDDVLEPVFKFVSRQNGFVAVSDVQVIRDDHF